MCSSPWLPTHHLSSVYHPSQLPFYSQDFSRVHTFSDFPPVSSPLAFETSFGGPLFFAVIMEEPGDPIYVDDIACSDSDPSPPIPSSDVVPPQTPYRYIGIDNQGEHVSQVFESPNGSRFYVPEVKPGVKPLVGSVFVSLDEALKCYEVYASKCGFAARTEASKVVRGVVTHRVYCCHRAGRPRKRTYDSVFPDSVNRARNTTFSATDCKALMRVKLIKGMDSYILYEFAEKHNHELVPSHSMDLLKAGRHLNFDDVMFVHSMSLNRIGPNVAHRLASTLKSGHHNMHGNKNSYKNVARDIRLFIGERDVQLFLNKLADRAANLTNYAYEFKHDGRELTSVFWCDNVSQLNFRSFGDVMTVDATYGTNKYNMIFVPFTGVDHHKRCVTFGAGLLKSESVESYQWLFESFLKVHQKQPRLVLTDQDPALRIAVPSVFSKSHHRLCMWHIMKKLPAKVAADILANTEVRSSIHKLVWNVFINPCTFEERWNQLIDQFNLRSNLWLRDMYGIRQLWVPAFFREIPLCCLMRTTSRSESSNAMFKVNSSAANTLVQFIMCYDSAVDNQRYHQRMEEYKTNAGKPVIQSGIAIEIHAAKIYTHNLFKEVQNEILKGSNVCFITNVEELEFTKQFTIAQMDKQAGSFIHFIVSYQKVEDAYDCLCRGFTRLGYLCRHIFCVFRYHNVTEIPCRYVLGRWKRHSLPSVAYGISSRLSADTSSFANVRNEILDTVSEAVDQFVGDVESMKQFKEEISGIKNRLAPQCSASSLKKRKESILKGIVGEVAEGTDFLIPPQGIRNKGCGTNHRLIGPGEKAVAASQKPKRLCRTCKEMVHHDSRNCPMNSKAAVDEAEQSSSEDQYSEQ